MLLILIAEVLLISTDNIRFHVEIRKISYFLVAKDILLILVLLGFPI